MIKTREPIINVITMTDLNGYTRVQKVFTESHMVYTYKDKLEVNHMGGRHRVFRNAQGNVISVHQWKEGRALSFYDVINEMKAKIGRNLI